MWGVGTGGRPQTCPTPPPFDLLRSVCLVFRRRQAVVDRKTRLYHALSRLARGVTCCASHEDRPSTTSVLGSLIHPVRTDAWVVEFSCLLGQCQSEHFLRPLVLLAPSTMTEYVYWGESSGSGGHNGGRCRPRCSHAVCTCLASES